MHDQCVVKIVISAVITTAVSEVAKRSTLLGPSAGLVGVAGSILILPITLVLLSLAEFVLMEALIQLRAALYLTASQERFQRRYVV
jgi:hypothetical protein